jgi:hypothetical protein
VGTFHHKFRSVLIHNWDNEDKRKEQFELFFDSIPEELKKYIIITNLINGYINIQFIPSGSKAGWDEYNQLNMLWAKFKDLINETLEYPEFVELQYGGDAGITYIIDTSDKVIEIDDSLALTQKDHFNTMQPIYNFLSNLMQNDPDIILKYTSDIESIIRQSGMKELQSNKSIHQDTYWMGETYHKGK